MYQGKFLAENKAAKQKEQPQKTAPALNADQIMNEELAAQEQVLPEIPAVKTPETPKPVKEKEEKPKKKKGIRVGTIIFYLLYLMLIGAAAYAINYGLNLLNDWLTVYEASQPDTRSSEIFNEHFANPDWGKIYDMAGLEGTQFEGKDAYIAYMEAKVGDSELTYSKTSAGLSGGQKYIVKLGDEKVATFTMQNPVTDELEIPEWNLDKIEAGFFTRDEDVTILTQPGRTVTLNGVPLDESYIVKTTSSVVDNYLPEGMHGERTMTLYAKGFLVAPEVMVIDKTGASMELQYNEETNTYSESVLANPVVHEISKEEHDTLVDATIAYCKHMIGAKGVTLKNHFDSTTAIYKSIMQNELWFKGYARYDFTEATVSEYVRYSDTLFSARIQITLNVYRTNGSLKAFPVNTTMFLEKNSKGQWLVNNMTNVNIHEILTQVRLTWMQDEEILANDMVDATTNFLTPPAVTVPEDKEFLGWFTESTDSDGNVTLSLVFAPTENGKIALADDYFLEPMVLKAQFDTPKGE